MGTCIGRAGDNRSDAARVHLNRCAAGRGDGCSLIGSVMRPTAMSLMLGCKISTAVKKQTFPTAAGPEHRAAFSTDPAARYPDHAFVTHSRAFPVGGPGSDLSAGIEAELREDVLDMTLGGTLGDDQFGGDLLVAKTLGDEIGNLAFSAGQCAWGARQG